MHAEWESLFPTALFNITSEITKHAHGFIGDALDLEQFVRSTPAPVQWHIILNASHNSSAILAPRSHIWGSTLQYTIYISWDVHRPSALNQEWTTTMTDFWAMLQERQQTAYAELGAARFLPGMTPDCFSHLNILNTISAKPCIPLSTPESYELWNFREWPEEPHTERVAESPPTRYLQGLEEPTPVAVDKPTRDNDMRKWKREGQTWLTAFMQPARRKIVKFFHQNTTANAQAAHEAKRRRRASGITSDNTAKFQKVGEVILTQEDIRPAARGKIRTWECLS